MKALGISKPISTQLDRPLFEMSLLKVDQENATDMSIDIANLMALENRDNTQTQYNFLCEKGKHPIWIY